MRRGCWALLIAGLIAPCGWTEEVAAPTAEPRTALSASASETASTADAVIPILAITSDNSPVRREKDPEIPANQVQTDKTRQTLGERLLPHYMVHSIRLVSQLQQADDAAEAAERAMESPESQSVIVSSAEIEDNVPNAWFAEESTLVPMWGLFAEPNNTYYQVDMLYWRASPPDQRTAIIDTISTDPTSGFNELGYFPGQSNSNYEFGFRMFLGHWLSESLAVELGGFWLHPDKDVVNFQAGSFTSGGFVGGVVQNFVIYTPTSEFLDFARLYADIRTSGIEANTRLALFTSRRLVIDGLAGARWITFNERFSFEAIPVAGALPSFEMFDSDNDYVVGQVGAQGRYELFEYVTLEGTFKVGAGSNFSNLEITGPPPGTPRLTGPTNQGSYSETEFAIIYDFTVGVGLQLTPNIRLHGGYSGIWLRDTLRAIDQIDLSALDAGQAPTVPFSRQSVWVSGLYVGALFEF